MKLIIPIALSVLLSQSLTAGQLITKDSIPAKSKDSTQCSNCSDITFLNAVNFDFGNKLTPSYLGLLNIFAPNLHHTYFGFNAGIEKINYSSSNINGNDSSSVRYFQQNFVVNPLQVFRSNRYDTVLNGAKYVQEYNQYSFTTANTVWSIYFQPLYKIVCWGRGKEGLYVHAHLELLVNQWSRTSTIKNLYTNPDTAVAVAPYSRGDSSFYWVKNNPIVSNYNFLTGNFGAGITYYTNLHTSRKDTSTHFWGQFTTGWSINAPNFDQLNNPEIIPTPSGTYSQNIINYQTAQAFYLAKMNFIESLSSSSQIIIGAVIRGLYKSPNVQYALFAGLNLDLSTLAKTITGN